MGKFDGILLGSDMDGTLLNSDSRVSAGNKAAIEYFTENGGSFTFTTGRHPHGLEEFRAELTVNCPSIVFNGSGIYDFNEKKSLYDVYLDNGADDAVDFLINAVPDCGVISVCDDVQYCSRDHAAMETYYKVSRYERMEFKPYREIEYKKKKFVILSDADMVSKIAQLAKQSEFAEKYNFMQTNSFLFEILPKGISKGSALKKLTEIYHPFKKIVFVGDGENDIEAIKFADVGIAVANAMDSVKEAADFVTVSNDDDAVREIIRMLDEGII